MFVHLDLRWISKKAALHNCTDVYSQKELTRETNSQCEGLLCTAEALLKSAEATTISKKYLLMVPGNDCE